MRKIKFRGKNEDGRWVYGSLLILGNNYFIFPFTNIILIGYFQYYVKEDTIGQFTGMYDKNCKEIYEGDIVEAWSEGVKAIGQVAQRNDGLWLLYPAWQHDKFWYFFPNGNGADDVEVIGNIYDNKELLEDKK